MSPITGALPITLYWIAVLLLAAGCLATIGIAHWQRKNKIIAIAAALLAVDLVLVALPSPESPLGVTIAIGILSISIAVLGGGIATTYVLKLATRGLVRPGLFGGIIVTEPNRTAGGALRANAGEQHEVLRGGRTIGYLERFAVAATLMAGFAEAIAVIIATLVPGFSGSWYSASTCGVRTRSMRRGSMTISFAPSRSRFFIREAKTG